MQISGGVVGGLVNLGTAYWMYYSIENLCEEAGAWSCPTTTNSFSVVSLWGLVGSYRLMGKNAEYFALNWFILGGFLVPIPFWLIWKATKSRKIKVRPVTCHIPLVRFMNPLLTKNPGVVGLVEASQHASAARSSQPMATCNCSYLHLLVLHGLLFQLLHIQVPSEMVAALQLRSVSCIGYRSCLWRTAHILYFVVFS